MNSLQLFKEKKLERLIFVTLFIVILVQMFVEIHYVIAFSSWPDLHAASPDEALLFEYLKDGQIFMFRSGYGPFFWLTMTMSISISPAGTEIEFTRIIFILLKYISFLLLPCILFKKEAHKAAIILLLLCITTPGYMFFGKIISPEYLLLLTTSISVIFLIIDSTNLTKYYYFALIFSFLGLITKFSMLPFFLSVIVYGFILIVLHSKSLDRQIVLKNIFYIIAIVIILILSVTTLTGFTQFKNDIVLIMSIVPKFSVSMSNLLYAWNRIDITWDQINIAGIKTDFLIVAIVSGLSILLLLIVFFKDKIHVLLSGFVFIAATVILLNQIFQSLAVGWYLFVPTFLYSIAFALLVEKVHKYIFVSSFFIIIGLYFYSGQDRLIEHILFKKENNEQLKVHTQEMIKIENYLRNNYNNIKTGNVDILVPVSSGNVINPWANSVIPMRVSLNYKSSGKWLEPDFIVVNKSIENISPLLQLVIKDTIDNYEFIDKFVDLDLYIKKDILNDK